MDRVRKMIRYSGAVRMGVSGENITVAVLDTGAMPHPDIAERFQMFRDFTKNNRISAYDDCGHGTHINGILAGDGRLSGGRLHGIAPKANLINIKILDHKGEGDADSMLRALQWIMDHRAEYRIRILNLSVAVYRMEDVQKLRELSDMLEELCERGILVITAAGNRGPEPGSISGLAAGAKVLTVGCHDYGYRDANGKSCDGECRERKFVSRISWHRERILLPAAFPMAEDGRCSGVIRVKREPQWRFRSSAELRHSCYRSIRI